MNYISISTLLCSASKYYLLTSLQGLDSFPSDISSTMIITWQPESNYLALLGGLLVGGVAVTRLASFGKVTGISGMLNGASTYKSKGSSASDAMERLYRVVFVLGIAKGGSVCYKLLPSAFMDWNHLPMQRVLLGGFLVGLGTSIGNGCTSGHGVCGISSMRVRSITATMAFMATGAFTAVATNTAALYPPFVNKNDMDMSLKTFAAGSASCALIYISGLFVKGYNNNAIKMSFNFAAEFLMGCTFAAGMAVSNMSMNSATISFLDVRTWNPALMFVMGGAIGLSAPLFYFIKSRGVPNVADKFDLPSSQIIDLPLLLGSAIFGVGWGYVGVCPGPALTNLFNIKSGSLPLYFILSMIGGFWTKEIMYDAMSLVGNKKVK